MIKEYRNIIRPLTASIIFAVSCQLFSWPAQASSDAFGRCLNGGAARQGVMPAIFDCYEAEYARQDELLNMSYRAVPAKLSSAKRRALVISQRRWLAERDVGCLKLAEQEMGKGAQDTKLAAYQCVLDRTGRRIEWLKLGFKDRIRKSIISTDEDKCMDRSGGITLNMLNCLGEDNDRLNIIMNNTYQEIYRNLSINNKKSLERDQKVWKEKTRRRCEQDPYMAMFEGGSYTTIIYSECFLEQRVARIEWLKARRAERY